LKPVLGSAKVEVRDLDIKTTLGKIVEFENLPLTKKEEINFEIYVQIA
jgi:hypothetical protein